MSLKDFLKEILELGKDDVFKVDVKDSFSFFNTEKEHEEKVLEFFTDFKYNGRFVNVEVSDNKGRSGGGKRDRGRSKRKGNDRSRSDKRSRRSNDSGFQGGRRSDRSNKGKRSASDRPRRSRRK